MSFEWPLAIALHQLGTIVWIGGMFFAHFALRPALNERLQPPQRLPVMLRVLDRFFPWVWLSILLLWASGLWVFLGIYGGKAGVHVHAMMGIALVMTLLFAYIWFGPYRRMGSAVEATDWPVGGAALARIRKIILINLILGLITAILGAAGPGLLAMAG